jgi:hypothetical protein
MDADSTSFAAAVTTNLVLFRHFRDNAIMVTDFSQIEQSALSLPELDRAKLAGTLLRSLHPAIEDDPELVAAEWTNVILARSDALHHGETKFVAGGQAIDELRTMILNSQSTDSK